MQDTSRVAELDRIKARLEILLDRSIDSADQIEALLVKNKRRQNTIRRCIANVDEAKAKHLLGAANGALG